VSLVLLDSLMELLKLKSDVYRAGNPEILEFPRAIFGQLAAEAGDVDG
jgi:hypothetical protein